jgi:curved DNA-binding protein CbpA
MKEYYALLGLDTKATKADIKKSYRKLATKFHPDKNSDADAPAKFIEITEAYNVLSDRKGRARYDLMRWQAMKQQRESTESFSSESYVSGSFTTMVPPKVSLRTRRNIAQKERGAQYKQAKEGYNKLSSLGVECLRISSRYLLHILGVLLFGFIFYSMWTDLGQMSWFGVATGTLILGYIIYKIVEDATIEFTKDMQAFSVFFGLTKRKAYVWSLVTLLLFILLLIGLIFKLG